MENLNNTQPTDNTNTNTNTLGTLCESYDRALECQKKLASLGYQNIVILPTKGRNLPWKVSYTL